MGCPKGSTVRELDLCVIPPWYADELWRIRGRGSMSSGAYGLLVNMLWTFRQSGIQ